MWVDGNLNRFIFTSRVSNIAYRTIFSIPGVFHDTRVCKNFKGKLWVNLIKYLLNKIEVNWTLYLTETFAMLMQVSCISVMFTSSYKIKGSH